MLDTVSRNRENKDIGSTPPGVLNDDVGLQKFESKKNTSPEKEPHKERKQQINLILRVEVRKSPANMCCTTKG